MRRVTSTTVLAAVLLAGPAAAGDSFIGLNVGWAQPTGDLGDGFDGDPSFSGHLVVPVLGRLGVRGEVGHNRVSLDDTLRTACEAVLGSCSGELKFTNVSAGLQYGGSGDGGALRMSALRVLPYVYATIGAYQVDGALTATGLPEILRFDDVDATYLGLGFGSGVNFRVGEGWGVQGDVRVHAVRPSEDSRDLLDWAHFVTPSVGVWFSF